MQFDLKRPIYTIWSWETKTGSQQDVRGYNSLQVQTRITAAKRWTVILEGSDVSGGPYKELQRIQLYSSRCWEWSDLPNFIRLVLVEEEDGAHLTVKAQEFNA